MILSFNPLLTADEHRILPAAAGSPGRDDLAAIARAEAVLLPQGRLPKLFEAARELCPNVFPDYSARYAYPGKSGDIRLFRKLGLAHPDSRLFASVAAVPPGFLERADYPMVLKSDAGGEGELVFAARDRAEAEKIVAMFAGMEESGVSGFVVQRMVNAGEATLRVAVMGKREYAYWRVQPEEGSWRHNLSCGAHVEREGRRARTRSGIELVRSLGSAATIDLAGVDVIFDHEKTPPEPLLLEINYFFGREGLGGQRGYAARLQEAVDQWLSARGIAPVSRVIDEDWLAGRND